MLVQDKNSMTSSVALAAPKEEIKSKDAIKALQKKLSRPSIRKVDHAAKLREANPVYKAGWTSKVLFLCVTVILLAGWYARDESNLTAETGLGYYLGIIGGVLMLMLLLYPLRKTKRFMRSWGPIKYWFGTHMVFGVLGPALILFHANFGLGSFNSQVALYSMLLVAGSGLIGRYFYVKIHYGLYGKRANLKGLRRDLQLTKGKFGKRFVLSKKIARHLKALESRAIIRRSFIGGLLYLPVILVRARWTYFVVMRCLMHDLKKQAKVKGWDAKIRNALIVDARRSAKYYVTYVRKVAEFNVYERMFSLWHILHFPLFIMLVISAIVHVIAVHLY